MLQSRHMTKPRRCVFYRTLAIDPNSRIGSALRPAKLLEAFRGLGYEVDVVAGDAHERKRAIDDVKRKITGGTVYDFLYAEPPTTPVLLNESHHLPTHPLLDYRFLAHCHARGIPVILFYSDVQWRLRDYPRQIGWPKYIAALPFFHLDLLVYRRVVDAWLVPHRGMLEQIAGWVAAEKNWPSIPGFDPLESPPPRPPAAPGTPLRLFYVGGVEPPVYDLTPLLKGSAWAASHGLNHVLTICCREPEWERRPAVYNQYLGDHVKVVHNRTRQELLELYAGQDIAVMPYGTTNSDWAMPIKFPEAIGMGLPILAGRGTAVGEVVVEQKIGWSIGGSEADLLTALKGVDRAELERVRGEVRRVRPTYEWAERAREIVAIAQELRAAESSKAGHFA
jgi:glycosyltransferase involved in cell wall biosynthesis